MAKREKCKGCLLYDAREVKYDGSPSASVVFVGESPGAVENKVGICFKGPSGEELRKTVSSVGMADRDICYINAARCTIDTKKMSKKEIKSVLQHCRPNVEKILKNLKPKLIVTLGEIAFRQIMASSASFKTVVGKWMHSKEFNSPVFAAYHPAAMLHDPSKRISFESQLRVVGDFYRAGFKHKDPTPVSYSTVMSIRHLLDRKNFVCAVDTETQGTDWTSPDSPVLCVSFSPKKGVGYVMWLVREVPPDEGDFTITVQRKSSGSRRKNMRIGISYLPEYDRRLAELREFLARSDIKKVMFHGTYDLLRFRQLLGDFEINGYVMDCQAAAHVIDENVYRMSSLDQVIQDFTDLPAGNKDLLSQHIDKDDMIGSDPVQVSKYAAGDSDGTRRAYISMRTKLLEDQRLGNYFARFLQPILTDVIYPMTANGIYIDQEYIPMAEEQLTRILEEQQNFCISRFPKKLIKAHEDKGLVLTRRDIMRDFLFEYKKIPPQMKTDKNGHSVKKDHLMLLMDHPKMDDETKAVIKAYLNYHESFTLLSRSINGLKKAIKPDGRIYSSISMVSTVTGRPASSNPNVFNIPKRSALAKIVRRLYAAPEGKVLAAFDLDQSELRFIAHESQDPVMLDIYRTGGDIHTRTAMALVGKEWNSISDEQKAMHRRSAKSVNFGFMYGMMPKTFMRHAYIDYGIRLDLEEATKWRETYFSLYPKVAKWHQRRIGEARKYKQVRSIFGRIRRLPTIDSDNPSVRSLAERQAINSPIQGASSDTGLLIAREVYRSGNLDKTKAKMVLFVYDEIVFEVDEDYVDRVTEVVPRIAANLPLQEYFGITLSVPIMVGCKIGKTLAEMEEIELKT